MANPSTGFGGAGTEVIRRSYLDGVGTSETTIITGVANHIITVLSIIIVNGVASSTDNYFQLYVDADLGGTDIGLTWRMYCNDKDTFTWSDRFALTETDKLHIKGYGTSVEYDVWCTYIDQQLA